MTIHSKWENGNLQFYDGTTDLFRITASSGAAFGSTGTGCVAKAYYVGTTGTAGASTTGSIIPGYITVTNGIVTACTT